MGISKRQVKEDHALQLDRPEVLLIERLQTEHLQTEHLLIERPQTEHLQIEPLTIDQHLGPPHPDRWGRVLLPVQVVSIQDVQVEVVQVQVEEAVEDEINFWNPLSDKKRRPFHLKWPPFLILLYPFNPKACQKHSYL